MIRVSDSPRHSDVLRTIRVRLRRRRKHETGANSGGVTATWPDVTQDLGIGDWLFSGNEAVDVSLQHIGLPLKTGSLGPAKDGLGSVAAEEEERAEGMHCGKSE